MRKPLLFKHVRYLKKLAEKCSVALKSVMFMHDFDNFKLLKFLFDSGLD